MLILYATYTYCEENEFCKSLSVQIPPTSHLSITILNKGGNLCGTQEVVGWGREYQLTIFNDIHIYMNRFCLRRLKRNTNMCVYVLSLYIWL